VPQKDEERRQPHLPLPQRLPQQRALAARQPHELAERARGGGKARDALLVELEGDEGDGEGERGGDGKHLLRAHRLEQRAGEVGRGEAARGLARPAERLQRARGRRLVLPRLVHAAP